MAQSLRTQRTGQVAVFIPYISNPLYAAYAAGAELALAEAGYLTVIFSNRAVPEQIDDYFDTVADSRVDGLILFPFKDDIARIERLRAAGCADRDRGPHRADWRGRAAGRFGGRRQRGLSAGGGGTHLLDAGAPQYRASSVRATRPMASRASRAIARPTPKAASRCSRRMPAAGRRPRVGDGFAMTQDLIAGVPGLSALVVTMNMPTLGALDAVRSARQTARCLPRLRFIGFDTDDDTHHLPDPMAAIRYPAIRLGRASADLLVQRLKAGHSGPALNTQMGADLFLGSSTAPPSPPKTGREMSDRITAARVIVTSPGRNYVTLKIETASGLTGIGDATLNGRELAVASYLRPSGTGPDRPRPRPDRGHLAISSIAARIGAAVR